MADDRIRIYLASLILLLGIISSSFNLQVIAAENLSKRKLSSLILQNEIVKEVNDNPNAGWKAALTDRFANATVAEFKRLLGVKPTPKMEFLGVPIVSHDISLILPKGFDARTGLSQCPSIARILGNKLLLGFYIEQSVAQIDENIFGFGLFRVTVVLTGHLVLLNHCLAGRFCIKYNMNVSLSVNDLLACCGFFCGQGCNGGYPLAAWRYFKHHDVVTEEVEVEEIYHDKEYRSKIWRFPSHNFTLSVIWSPFLVKAETFENMDGVSFSDIQLHLDELDHDWTDQYINFDYVVISGGKWFLKTSIFHENNTVTGCHYCQGKNSLTELGYLYSYRKALRLVLNFVAEPNHKAEVMFRTTTPDHFENGEWNSGGFCIRTMPFKENEGEIKSMDASMYVVIFVILIRSVQFCKKNKR